MNNCRSDRRGWHHFWCWGQACLAVFLALGQAQAGEATPNAPRIKAAIVEDGYGAKGILASLTNEPALDARLLPPVKISFENLIEFDVVIVPSVALLSTDRSSEKALVQYVRYGGGLLLQHKACGLNADGRTLFPEAVRAVARHNGNKLVAHPEYRDQRMLQDVPPSYELSYTDYYTFNKTGTTSKVWVYGDGEPVAASAEAGNGRVFYNGACTGLGAGEVETAALGGERQILLNAVRWLAENRVSAFPAERLAAWRDKIKQEELKIKADKYDEIRAHRFDWFDEDLLQSAFLQRPPVETLGGRYFLIARVDFLNKFGYVRTRQNLHALKLMGVTDIIQLTIRGVRVYHPVKDDPFAKPDYSSAPGTYDPFAALLKAAAEEGMHVWFKLQLEHSSSLKASEKEFFARDGKGKLYPYKISDVLSPGYRAFLRRMIDLYAAKYAAYGSLKGMYVDMPYANGNDHLGDDADSFGGYCLKNFGEAPPENIKSDVDAFLKRTGPGDVWWRRWVLFKQWVNEDFNRELADYCKGKGFEFAIQVESSVIRSGGWAWGNNPYRMSRIAESAWIFSYPNLPGNEIFYVLPQSTAGSFNRLSLGQSATRSFRGHQAGLDFPFMKLWRPLLLGMTPTALDRQRKMIVNQREWSGAALLTRAAVLRNENNLLLRLGNSTPDEIWKKESPLLERLSYHFDWDVIMVENTNLYSNYRVLIAPPLSVSGLSEPNLDALRGYVNAGGIIVSLDAPWTTSRPDLTQEQDRAVEMSGKPGQVPSRGFAQREQSMGKGKVITVSATNIFQGLAQGEPDLFDPVLALLAGHANPEITLSSPTEPHVQIMTTLRKNNWVAVSLYSNDKTPAHCVVSVDLERLGLKHPAYRLLLLGRNMEQLRPGDWEGGRFGQAGFWTAADFRNGVRVSILKDDEVDLDNPRDMDLSAYTPFWQKYLQGQVFNNCRNESFRTRYYAHEIMVIAPADELNIEGEKID